MSDINSIIAQAQQAQAQQTQVAQPMQQPAFVAQPVQQAFVAPVQPVQQVVMQPVANALPAIPAAAPQNDWMAKLSAGFGQALNEASNETIPAGQYKVQVGKFELTTSKSGLPMVKKEYRIADGVHAGRKLSEFAVLGKTDGSLNAWGIATLKAQMETILKVSINDFNQMIGYLGNIEKAGAIATATVTVDGQYNRVDKLAL